jgi:hypothetical protein
MEIIPKIGIGPLRFGMTPGQVRALFPEQETYEDWMGGNLNDSILYRGLIIEFDLCDSWGPLARSKFRGVRLHRREDAILWGKYILDWCKSDAIDYLKSNGFAYHLANWGDLSVPQSSLVLSFDDLDRLEYLEMWSGDFVETDTEAK